MKSDEYMLHQTGPYMQLTMENFIFDRISVDIICIIQGEPNHHPTFPKRITKFYPAKLLYKVLNQNHKNILCTCSGRKLHHTYNSFQTRTMVFMLSSHHPWFHVVLLYCLLYTPPILVWDYSWTTLFSEWKYQVAGCVPVHGRFSSSKLWSFWLRFSCT